MCLANGIAIDTTDDIVEAGAVGGLDADCVLIFCRDCKTQV